MRVRLAFAVAAHLEPDILVVDEVLAVGDAEFQKKAIGKMQDISKGDGRTILFVSHNMAAVKSLCSRGIVLENGGIVFDGETEEAVEHYLDINFNRSVTYKTKLENNVPHIKEIEILTNQESFFHDFKEDLKIKITLYSPEILIEPAISYQIVSIDDEPILHELNLYKENKFGEEIGTYELISEIKQLSLYPGIYKLNVFFADNFLKKKFDQVLNACSFEIILKEKRDYYYDKGSAIYKEKNTLWKIKKID